MRRNRFKQIKVFVRSNPKYNAIGALADLLWHSKIMLDYSWSNVVSVAVPNGVVSLDENNIMCIRANMCQDVHEIEDCQIWYIYIQGC